jgi:hypothetical protein
MKGTIRTISIEIEVPPDFFKMQDWLGQSAEPLEAVALRAVHRYIHSAYDLYSGRPKDPQ